MRIRIILFLITTILFIACKDDMKSESVLIIENQPMSIGSEWNYVCSGYYKYYDFRNQNNLIYIDSIIGPAKVWIEKDTLVNDTLKLTVFKGEGITYIYHHRGTTNNYKWETSEYKNIDKDGLKTHAYIQSSGPLVYAKNKNTISLPDYFLNNVLLSSYPNKTNTGGIYFEEVPLLNVKLPLEKNDLWSFRKPVENSFDIDKKVVGSETIKIGVKYYSCLIVEWKYNEPNNLNIKVTDWISKEGLIKRKSTIEDIRYVDENNNPYYVDFEETITLKNTKLN